MPIRTFALVSSILNILYLHSALAGPPLAARAPLPRAEEFADNCEDLLVERSWRAGQLSRLASRTSHTEWRNQRGHFFRAARRLTVARGLEKAAAAMEEKYVFYALVGPRPATNLPGLRIPEFDPRKPAASLDEQLRALSDWRESYTLLVDLTGEESSRILNTVANARLWRRIDAIIHWRTPVRPAFVVVGATTGQVPINYRALQRGQPNLYLRLPVVTQTLLREPAAAGMAKKEGPPEFGRALSLVFGGDQ